MKIFSLLISISFFCNLFSQNVTVGEKMIREAMEATALKANLSPADIAQYRISDQYVQKQNGASHVYINQTIGGNDIFNAQMQLHFSNKGTLVFSSSTFIKDAALISNASVPGIELKTAFATIFDTLSLPAIATEAMRFVADSVGRTFKFTDNSLFLNPVRATVGYEKSGDKLILVYQFSLEKRADKRMYVVRVDALTGKIVRIINRTLECTKNHEHQSEKCLLQLPANSFAKPGDPMPKSGAAYNAFPLGVESPIHGSRQIISNVENSTASPYGWHDVDGAVGAEYTITKGNNVHAYDDTSNNNSIGYSPEGGPALSFDFPLNLNALPAQNMDAALTNLFVWNNFMHDVTYHYGFDEQSGNFQLNNYGNGGENYDPVDAEGLDGGGFNNANFGTPEDGYSPTMQMYVWVHVVGNLLNINAPGNISGEYTTGSSTFGLGGDFPPVTADIVLINSGGPNSTKGCTHPYNDLTGKIALIDRGNCEFADKVIQAQDGGAVGVIIANNYPGGIFAMGGDDQNLVYIPVVSISLEDGDLIKAALLNGVVNATLGGNSQITRLDGDFDNGVIAHEYGHGISNRLTGGPSQVECLSNDEQAGEGWSDFFALIMTNTPTLTADDARAIGNFASNNLITGGGIRQYPYSRNMSVNPFTYADVQDVAVPHGVGSVWCTMLWDLYWNMNDAYGSSNDLYATNGGNNKAIQLVMEGMRMQSCDPGFVDARDAILAADQLLYNGDNACLIWKTFARRGLGYSADQGSSYVLGDENEAFDVPSFCNLGVKELSGEDFTIYPVPTTDVLKVINSKGLFVEQLVIYDLSGKEISRKTPTGNETQMDVSALTSGVYLLQIQSNGSTFQKRFVIL